jgi:acyl carrier protein
MNDLEKFNQVFITNLKINEQQLKGLSYQDSPNWDSVGHMGLIAALEEAFDIMIDTDDIIDFSSYEKGKDILKKYNVKL